MTPPTHRKCGRSRGAYGCGADGGASLAVGRDGGLGERLRAGRRQIQVLSLDRENGIEAKPFPKLWICPGCGRVHKHILTQCPCGSKGRRGQVHFVSDCSRCGELDEPPIARCDVHDEIAIRFPGSMSASGTSYQFLKLALRIRSSRNFLVKRCSQVLQRQPTACSKIE